MTDQGDPQGKPAPGGPAAPVPSLPKGGGAIRGIGEKFSANPVTGTASLQIPVATSPGRAGFHPELALAYDSGAGNGPFGHGWQLSVPHIARKTDKGLPTYDAGDVFVLSGAEDLVPGLLADGSRERFVDGDEIVERYRPRVEGGFVRIEQRTVRSTGVVYWQATTHDNVTSTYGRSEGARIADPRQQCRIFSWLIEETRDDRGNVITYVYKAENLVGVPRGVACEANRHDGVAPIANRYLERIRYGNTTMHEAPTDASPGLFELVFDYGEHDAATPTVDEAQAWPARQDPFSTYRAGFEIRTYRLCRRVLMFHRVPELGVTPCLVASTDFTYANGPVLTQLVASAHSGYIRNADGVTYTKKSRAPLTFGYASAQIRTDPAELDRRNAPGLPVGIDGHRHQWVDLDGEGIPGVLSEQPGALYYAANLGEGRFALPRPLATRPSFAAAGGQILDLDADGRKEMVFFDRPMAGYFERAAEDGWAPFVPFSSYPNVDLRNPHVRFIDLSGDGHEDILLTLGDDFVWYPSLGKEGFGPPRTFARPRDEERGPPALVSMDRRRAIFLADMSGDGLSDIVRVENSNVCYWPNLGYGCFGAKVQMDGTEPFDFADQFDPKRIRLADVDGSGTTDLLYIGREGVSLRRNQAGNALGPAGKLPAWPGAEALSTVAAVDLFGTGTACLVWSAPPTWGAEPPLHYIDLMGGKKPYLLTSVTNNLGLTTTLEYTPSTRFYLADAAAGRPWVTRLAFPVQTLTRTETYDAVSRHRFVSKYAYHHGYFDGAEREFRGFGLVEQWDTESFAEFSGTGELPPPANASDPEMHVPPVYTKTWFHTGAWEAGARIARQYAHEYWQGDPKAALLPGAVLPGGLGVEDGREACRALKGQFLRQEIYAQDGSALQGQPYLVSERSYEVRQLQPVVTTHERITHGVFFAHKREAIEYHHERDTGDPRVTHAFTLEVDDHGVVVRSAAVGYPRRAANLVFDEQKRVAVTLSEVDVFHHAPVMAVGWYRIGVPIETRSYELTGLVPAADAAFSFQDVLGAADEASAQSNPPLPYDGTPDPTKKQKRLLSQARTLYDADDLSGPLALGVVKSLALPYQSYAKAFTPALLASALGGRATDAILTEGGYVRFLAEDDAWWVPSGRQVFSASAFYLPVGFMDAFGNTTSIAYDGYKIAVTGATDPIGNVVQAAIDYRVLAPVLVTDGNQNRVAARFDELGMVVATALMGKAGANEGDTLADPTTTFAYDLDRYRLTGKPNVVHARAREQHGAVNTRWQESYRYSDGSGHEVMRKIQAEPGEAPQRDASGALVHDAQGKLVLAEASPRWVGSGRTVFDNKGNPVKQYEPFFSATFEFEDEADLVEQGVTPILRYDPLGRLIRTDLPNGTFSRVVFDPWKQTTYDPNDTVLQSAWYQDRKGLDPTSDPEGRAAYLTSKHANTPSIVHLDALGRTFRTIEDNGGAEQYVTTVTLDVEGNPLTITDARGNLPQVNVFAMRGHKLYQKSCDAGERWMLADVGEALLQAWDERKFTRRAVYDDARRVTHLYVQREGGAEFLAERTVYGEALGVTAAVTNHRGRIYQHYDGAGVVTSVRHDFKGNLLEGERRLAKAYQAQASWLAIKDLALPDVLASPTKDLLEDDGEAFGTTTAYDALNRPTSLITPDASEVLPTYNEAGLLERVDVRVRGAQSRTAFVDDIDYDAKGQREKIVYGAAATETAYTYDPLTFRLTHLKTSRASDGAVLQNLAYTYDPVGNITEVGDSAQQAVFFANDVALPKMAYVYDALYRLMQATGREQAGANADVQRDQNDVPLMNLPHQNDAQAVRAYSETYQYDAVGNILQMAHDGGAAATSWTRRYNVDPTTNRLLGTSLAGDQAGQYSASYTYDPHGNMLSMPHLASVGWNHRDEMASTNLGGGGTVYFTYDAAGQRVRKVWEHSGLVEERIYLGGGYEVYRKRVASTQEVVLERQTLHVMDGVRRIALVETKTVDAEAGGAFQVATVTRFQMGNHLGSAVLEVDAGGMVISYEEYHPYGTTAYQSGTSAAEVSRKRYRYTGKEKDEETGLYYHGARYYAPWLGRWTAADPAGMVDGPNIYRYCQNSPVVYSDDTGKEPSAAKVPNNAHEPPSDDLRPKSDPWQFARYDSGLRVGYGGDLKTAENLRARGLPGLAEVAESGGCAWCHLTKDSHTLEEAESKIDAGHYRKMSTLLGVAAVWMSVAAAVGMRRAETPADAPKVPLQKRAGGTGGTGESGTPTPPVRTHVQQQSKTGCGPACGEMASEHHAAASQGAKTNQATLMQQAEYDANKGGMDPGGLAASLERKASVKGRQWAWESYLDEHKPTVTQVRESLKKALDEGGGVAVVETVVTGPTGQRYRHFVTVDAVTETSVHVRDPELTGARAQNITDQGFGKYQWTGDTVVAKVKAKHQ